METARGGEILAAPFDVDTLRLRGTPVPVIEDVLTNLGAGSAQFTASGGGSTELFDKSLDKLHGTA